MQEPFPDPALRTAYEGLACGITVHAASGAILYANKAAEALLGLSLAQLQGAAPRDPCWQLLREEGMDLAPAEWPALKAMRTRQPQPDLILCLALPSGEWRWLKAGAALMLDTSDAPLRVVTTFWDVTESRRAVSPHEGAAHLYATFEQAAVGIVHLDVTGRVLRANRQCGALFGYPPASLSGRSLEDLVFPDGRAAFHEQFAALMAGAMDRLVVEQRYLRRAGGSLWLRLTLSLVQDAPEETPWALGFAEDCTPRRESEERLRLLESAVLHSRDAVAITQVDQRASRESPVVFVNDAFTRLTGYAGEDILGKSSSMLDGPETDPAATAATFQSLLRGESAQAELLTYRKDGSTYWADYIVVPLPDVGGRITHWISFERDITERKRTEEALRTSEARLRAVVQNAPLVLFAYDREGIVNLATGGGLDLLNFQSAERIGKSIFTLYRERPDILAHCLRALAGEAHTASYEINGRLIEVRLLPQYDAGGAVDGVISVAFDVTEHARALHEAERARAAAENLAHLRSDFVAAVSHELRTPLTAIVGFAELLEARWKQFSEAQRLGRIANIVQAANRQLRLVEDLLLISRLETAGVTPQCAALSLAALVEQAVAEVQGSHPGQPVVLQGACGLEVWADGARTIQVLANLLDNAAKYSPEGRSITASWECEGEIVVVRVADQGSGVPAEGRDQLFTRFGRVPGSRIRAGRVGTGLGLYISRKLAEAMGGNLDLEETGPRGTTFRLRLPAYAADPVAVGER
jgi:PAS domain S-box-containing protein